MTTLLFQRCILLFQMQTFHAQSKSTRESPGVSSKNLFHSPIKKERSRTTRPGITTIKFFNLRLKFFLLLPNLKLFYIKIVILKKGRNYHVVIFRQVPKRADYRRIAVIHSKYCLHPIKSVFNYSFCVVCLVSVFETSKKHSKIIFNANWNNYYDFHWNNHSSRLRVYVA